jgi:signal transduction histidine kinase/ActR/RegA family two-component response regulator
VWSAEGNPLVGSRSFPVPASLDISDRAYFRFHRTHRNAWYVSELLTGRQTGAPFIDVSTRRELPGGEFGGVVSTTILPGYFADFYRTLESTEPGLSVSLMREDGHLLARWPAAPEGTTRMDPAGKVMKAMSADSVAGMVDNVSAVDGKRRIAAYRKVTPYPLYIVAGIDHRPVLGAWYRNTALLAAFTFPASIALGFVSWVAMRRTRRDLLASERLKRESEHRMQAEDALRQAQKLEALGQLTGGVAHDFNNLLMVVNNNVHLLSRLVPQTAGSPQIAAIDRAVTGGTRLTRQLLAFSRRQAVTPEVISVNDAVPAMMDLLRTSLGSSIRIEFVPQAAASFVKVDAAEFELALLNLTINARDAMQGGGELTIRTRSIRLDRRAADLEAGQYVVLSVTDSGRGVPQAMLAKVFEPFFTTKKPGQGTGLGLSQVYGFCVQAGGVARMESETRAGTTVSMYLPASAAPGEAAAVAEAPPADGRLRGRLLLVEDNLEVAAATKPLLEALGCSVVHVVSADAALDTLSEEAVPFDVVLSDILMPGSLNGLDLAMMLRHQNPGLPVLLMTGYAAQTGQAMASGFHVLAKPVSAAALATAIGGALSPKPVATASRPT